VYGIVEGDRYPDLLTEFTAGDPVPVQRPAGSSPRKSQCFHLESEGKKKADVQSKGRRQRGHSYWE
jgi:hypothetical protein